MIASSFPQGTSWGWEVLSCDGTVVASGVAATAEQARWASFLAWTGATAVGSHDLSRFHSGENHFGGRWGSQLDAIAA